MKKKTKTLLRLLLVFIMAVSFTACGEDFSGSDGSDGVNSLVVTSPADKAHCPYGGTMVEVGADSNSNNILDTDEVDKDLTSYVCNGTDPSNSAPVADAGTDRTVSANLPVTLDGSGSSDAEDPIAAYSWSFVLRPEKSSAELSDPSAQSPAFTPDIAGTYVLSLTVGDGQVFSTPDYVMITVRAWSGAVDIDAGDENADVPQVVFDTNGNAFTVWIQKNGTYNSVYANRYDAGTGSWTGAVIINAVDGSPGIPQVAVDASGNAFAVWEQMGGTDSIYANRYDSGTGSWTGAVIIDAGALYNFEPQVAVDASGNAFAVWTQHDGTYQSVYANLYDAGTGSWTGAVPLEASDYDAEGPHVAVDASGNAFALWQQKDGTNVWNVYANRYDDGSGSWSGAVDIDAGSDNAEAPYVAFDTSGNAFALWSQEDGTYYNIYANRYDAGTGLWEGAVNIEAGAYYASSPQVAFDADGNAIVVWRHSNGTYNGIYASRYDAGSGLWSGAVSLEAGDNLAYSLQVAIDADGNAFSVWRQSDGTFNSIYANRYDAGSGLWSGAVEIDAGDNTAYYPDVAIDANGNTLAVWQQSDGTRTNIYASWWE